MYGKVSDEKAVKVPATEAWKLCGTLRLAKFVQESLPHLVTNFEVVEGDGTAGTILRVFFPPGNESRLKWYEEKFTVVDNEKRVKVAEAVEGGNLDKGFTLYRFRLEVIEEEGKGNECLIRYTIEYELEDESGANSAVVSIQPFTTILNVAAEYLQRNYNDGRDKI